MEARTKNENNEDDDDYWKGIIYSFILLKSKPHWRVFSFHLGTLASFWVFPFEGKGGRPFRLVLLVMNVQTK